MYWKIKQIRKRQTRYTVSNTINELVIMASENSIDYIVIDSFNSELIQSAAKLYMEHLSDNGFLPLFGNRFIQELYADILAEKLGFFIFATKDNSICGFVLGSADSEQIFKIITRKFFKYFKIILPRVLTNPIQIVPKLFETLFYVKKQKANIKAELVTIITDSNYRAKGLGTQIVEALNKEFLKRGVYFYKVTVHDVKQKANNFYLKNGFKYSTSFNMHNLKWNVYTNQLNNER
jgi:GNAT superfamily N-acetyltransferase